MFEQYASILLRENAKYNLTAITAPEEIRQKHFEDSLALLGDELSIAQGASLLDVGSGAGFPGVPLKIARPDLQVTLLEATAKKAQFLALLARELELTVRVLNERAEQAAHERAYREAFDVVTARAVAALPVLCELCLPFVKIGGVFAAYKGTAEKAERELRGAENAIEALGAQLERVHSEDTVYGGRTRIILRKKAPTPPVYPRNYGLIKKKPL